ncbi:MAG: Stf0 family sulfotransferase [Pseudomonadota bacterium]
MAAYKSYVICTSSRSGSTLLCRLLAATGVAGAPDSHFHEPSIDAWLKYYDLKPGPECSDAQILDLIFKAALTEGTAGTAVFGLRLQRHSFDFFAAQLAKRHPGLSKDVDTFQAEFGRTQFIYLTRQDKVEQAVSYVKAEQSGLWHMAPDGTELERLSAPQVPVYDADAIKARVEELSALDAAWLDWFTSQAIEPLRITYTDLSADPVLVLRRILEALGLDPETAEGVQPGVAKLADQVSHDWVQRFRRDFALSV